jgi:hypothetical protein
VRAREASPVMSGVRYGTSFARLDAVDRGAELGAPEVLGQFVHALADLVPVRGELFLARAGDVLGDAGQVADAGQAEQRLTGTGSGRGREGRRGRFRRAEVVGASRLTGTRRRAHRRARRCVRRAGALFIAVRVVVAARGQQERDHRGDNGHSTGDHPRQRGTPLGGRRGGRVARWCRHAPEVTGAPRCAGFARRSRRRPLSRECRATWRRYRGGPPAQPGRTATSPAGRRRTSRGTPP